MKRMFNLQFLKTDGNLIIDIGEGDVNISGGDYNNLIIIESGISNVSNDELEITDLAITKYPNQIELIDKNNITSDGEKATIKENLNIQSTSEYSIESLEMKNITHNKKNIIDQLINNLKNTFK
ncbi:hypothetical protein [Clostridium sp. DL1XJH146]